jgi:D-hydroxyproline dehydrogenase subunit gamma
VETKESKVNMENDLRIQRGIGRGQPFTIQVNGKPVTAYPGETLAAAMLAAGWRMFRHTALSGEPRGLFCGMGICYDCLVTVNGRANVRACATYAQPGDEVERQI